jgi:hypothetical protein
MTSKMNNRYGSSPGILLLLASLIACTGAGPKHEEWSWYKVSFDERESISGKASAKLSSKEIEFVLRRKDGVEVSFFGKREAGKIIGSINIEGQLFRAAGFERKGTYFDCPVTMFVLERVDSVSGLFVVWSGPTCDK